jgi:metabolite-proton symporter
MSGLSDQEHSKQLRRAVIASTIGTAIEWYDFFLYSTVTGLVFAKLFFPQSEPLIGTLQAFSVYFVGFIARPIGAAIFGHYGDRIGRKSTLIATLFLMGVATFLVGLVPSYDSIGLWGAVLLTLLRFIQGIGVGGEWGGSILLAMEWAKTNKHRGFITSWPQFGVPVGLFLANLAVLAFSSLSGDEFPTWGWRVPFLLSILLLGVGLYIRLGILETPTFTKLTAEKKIEKAPVLEVIKRQPKEIILSGLCRVGQQSTFYIFTAFIFTYGTVHLKVERNFLIQAVLVASVFSFFSVPFFGWLSDRWGRKRTYITGLAILGVFTFIYFSALDTLIPWVIFLTVAISLIPHDMSYAPQGALVAESFTGRLRYSGASLGYQVASIMAGGPAPLIATALLDKYKTGYAIAIYLALGAVISIIATMFLPDRTNKDISAEYDALPDV